MCHNNCREVFSSEHDLPFCPAIGDNWEESQDSDTYLLHNESKTARKKI
jgi:hypothetical protein